MTTKAMTEPEASPDSQREFESKKQLAARLGVSVRTIDNLLAKGLPFIRLTSKLIRFPRVAVDQWLTERQVRRC
jgi:excisionase family DNA binding protein